MSRTPSSDPITNWRNIVLYGRNVTTYKIALARTIAAAVAAGQTRLTRADLAASFLTQYRDRLATGMPQGVLAAKPAVMETIAKDLAAGTISEERAHLLASREAFDDVIPRFHTVDREQVPVPFYVIDGKDIVLTDAAADVWESRYAPALSQDIHARWDTLEAGFRASHSARALRLSNDTHHLQLVGAGISANVTSIAPILAGYQRNTCIHCGDPLADGIVVPMAPGITHLWGIALAHSACAENAAPTRAADDRLITRNHDIERGSTPLRAYLVDAVGPALGDGGSTIHRLLDHARRIAEDRGRWAS